jgi:hypothetical protein
MIYKYTTAVISKLFILSLIILPSISIALSTEFDSLFNIKPYNSSILISNKHDVAIPKDSQNVLHKLYSHVSKYGEIELYTSSNGKKLAMIPAKRIQIFYKSPIYIQILNEAGKPDYTFDLSYNKNDKPTPETEKQNIIYLKDVFSSKALEPLVAYLESSSSTLYTESFITLFKPKTVVELLTSFVYSNKIEVKCLISTFPNLLYKAGMCSILLMSDVYGYGTGSMKYLYSMLRKKPEAVASK